jgi:hypothetical protein
VHLFPRGLDIRFLISNCRYIPKNRTSTPRISYPLCKRCPPGESKRWLDSSPILQGNRRKRCPDRSAEVHIRLRRIAAYRFQDSRRGMPHTHWRTAFVLRESSVHSTECNRLPTLWSRRRLRRQRPTHLFHHLRYRLHPQLLRKTRPMRFHPGTRSHHRQ